MSNGTSQTSSYLSRKSFNIDRQVSVVKQGVSIRSFRYLEYILYVIYFTVNDFVFKTNKVSDAIAVCHKRQSYGL